MKNNNLLWKEHFLQLAHYNVWAYQVLLESVASLSDAQFTGNAGLCFRSIHGTLNHLIASDVLWYSRLIDEETDECKELRKYWHCENTFSKPEDTSSIWEEYIKERSRVIEMALHGPRRYVELITRLADTHDFHDNIRYTGTDGIPKELSWRIALTHIFNHETHHRGQISAAITGYGLPPPSMDFIFYPGAKPIGKE
ncbi:DNA damage-inducible protein DinB [Syncephalis plumigaleata]|nr:DNA damage-inducible protein DinB [Syncephalis plumigaleata]